MIASSGARGGSDGARSGAYNSRMAALRSGIARRILFCLLAGPALAQGPASVPGLANPASQNCVAKGGRIVIETGPGRGQFGVCTFDNNLQCEEWAMLRGTCRTGGIRVTGFVTQAARYCAITGGSYAVMSGSNTPGEQGRCALPSGVVCSASAYFDGTCPSR